MLAIDLADMPPLSEENADHENGASYAQVDTFEDCPRKWGFRWLERKERKNKFSRRGIDAHQLTAKWLRSKILPPGMTTEGKLAQALLLHLPPPQNVDPKNVELESVLKISGVSFFLGVDLWMPTGFALPRVYDHKTTTELKWALKPDGFQHDIQATLYAAWALVKTGAPKVEVQWTYATTKNAPSEPGKISNWQPKVLPVVSTLTGRQCQDRLGKSIETAREMNVIRDSGVKSALELPYDARACGKYGGCPYKDVCKLTPEMEFDSLVAQRAIRSKQQEQESKMAIVGDAKTLAERMAARRTNGAGTPAINPPAAEAPTPVQQAAPATGGLAARMAARAAAQAPAQAAAAVQETPAPAAEPETPQRRPRGRPPKAATQAAAASAAPAAPMGEGYVVIHADTLQELVDGVSQVAVTAAARPDRDRWSWFASNALGALVGTQDPVEALNPGNAAELSGIAAVYADELEAQFKSRFTGK